MLLKARESRWSTAFRLIPRFLAKRSRIPGLDSSPSVNVYASITSCRTFLRKGLKAGAHFIGRLQGPLKVPRRFVLRLPNVFNIRKVRDARLSGSFSMKHLPHLATDQAVEFVGVGVRRNSIFQPLVNPINIRLNVADATCRIWRESWNVSFDPIEISLKGFSKGFSRVWGRGPHNKTVSQERGLSCDRPQ